jgi:hypothetical protein
MLVGGETSFSLPKQVGTNDGKTTFGFVLSRYILTQPRGSEN